MNEPRSRGRIAYIAAVSVVIAAGVIGFGAWFWKTHVATRWLPADDDEIASLFLDNSEVAPDDENGFGFTYRPAWSTVQTLFATAPDEWRSYRTTDGQIVASFDDEESAEFQLKALRELDKPPAGEFLFRGRIVDAAGEPVAAAIVDLLGPWVFVNHFRTRDDGTFVMPLSTKTGSPPAKWGYYLRIRAADETADKHHRWNTMRFSLNPSEPHWGILITLPEDL